MRKRRISSVDPVTMRDADLPAELYRCRDGTLRGAAPVHAAE